MNSSSGFLQKIIEGLRVAVLQLQVKPLDIIDILILAFLIYQLLKITRETRAYELLKGFGIIIVAAQVSQWLGLTGVAWVLNSIVSAGVIALVILFQPELRRALERLGAGRLLDAPAIVGGQDDAHTADELCRAVQNLAKKRTGALIAVQRTNTLSNIVESGISIDAQVTGQLLENIFVPNTPLHDGATIINGTRIVAAGCFLPLTNSGQVESDLGTRHRAALGMSETTDALVIVVSEETGIISIAEGGKLLRYLDGQSLRQALEKIYGHRENVTDRLLHFNGLIKRRKRKDEPDA